MGKKIPDLPETSLTPTDVELDEVEFEIDNPDNASGERSERLTRKLIRGGYKDYVALLTQSGASNPTVIMLENGLGTISFARNSDGNFSVTATGLLVIGKTDVFFNNVINGAVTNFANIFVDYDTITVNGFDFVTYGDGGTAIDEVLKGTRITIRVYE